MISLTLNQTKDSLSTVYKTKKKNSQKKTFLRKRGNGGLNQKYEKKAF